MGGDPIQAEKLAAEEAARSPVFFRSAGGQGAGLRPQRLRLMPCRPSSSRYPGRVGHRHQLRPAGRYLLIPQGSRLVGRYDSQVAFGRRRVPLVWTRLILPDTSPVALDRLPGIDPAGYAGLEDGVDWHRDRVLAGAALSTLLGMGAELAAPATGSSRSNR